MITTVNPATGKDLNHYEEYSFEKLAEIAARADEVQKHWQTTDFSHRAELMHKAAELLRQRKEDYGRLMALEMGKPLPQGIAEAEKCAWVCDYYADNAEDHLTDIPVSTEMSKSYVAFRPLGVVLAIMPWNFPFWQVFRFAAPALMAGNAGLLKHASNTMGSAVEIEKIFLEAGFPEGLFASLIVSSGPILHLIEDPNIKAVTLTGSTPVGKKVAEKAGSMLKKTVLELGGSDPYVVLADCDLDKTVDICVASRLINNGQSCISAKRFIVEKSIKGKFEVLFTERMKSKVMGYQLDKGTDIGPLARKDLMLDLHSQVERSVADGAKLLLGGKLTDSPGYYYPPTVLTDVAPGMAAFDEETFGPVAAIIEADSEDHAIELANDSIFGLGAAVFTSDVEKGESIARDRLEAGACFVNDFVKSDPRLPFGGISESGYGRELGIFGIREFMNIKTVCVK